MVLYQKVKVYPGSKNNHLDKPGVDGDGKKYMRIRLKQRAESGKANMALIGFLSELLTVSRKDIEIAQGHTSSWKLCAIHNTSQDKIDQLNTKMDESSTTNLLLRFEDIASDNETEEHNKHP